VKAKVPIPAVFLEDERSSDVVPIHPISTGRFFLSRFRGMMNTPQLAAWFLGVAVFDTARLAARSFIPAERSEIFLQIRHCIALGRRRQPMTVRWRQDARSNP
jgi:hypothetical protein